MVNPKMRNTGSGSVDLYWNGVGKCWGFMLFHLVYDMRLKWHCLNTLTTEMYSYIKQNWWKAFRLLEYCGIWKQEIASSSLVWTTRACAMLCILVLLSWMNFKLLCHAWIPAVLVQNHTFLWKTFTSFEIILVVFFIMNFMFKCGFS